MPFWALLPCLLRPFCGEGMADHVWKGQVWSWRCYFFKGEKMKEWKNEELIFNAQNSYSILLKSQFLSSMLDVLSSKSPTFQAQYLVFYLPKVQLSKLNTWCFIFQKTNFPSSMLDVLSSKRLTFQIQMLDVLSSKSLTFQAQTLDVLSPKRLTLQAQMLDVLSSKRLTFQAQTLGVLSLKSLTFQVQTLDVLSLKSPTFQAQEFNVSSSKAQISSLESCCPTLLCLPFCSFFF